MKKIVFLLNKEKETMFVGYNLGKIIKSKIDKYILYFYGDLGSGKTTFIRGFLRGLGYTGVVKSPSYTLLESYFLKQYNVYHFDFYRVNSFKEIELLGIQDFFYQNFIFLIEWAEKGENFLSLPDIKIYLSYLNEDRRMISLFFLNQKLNIISKKKLMDK
ncbi:MAG: tRNA (adenosine(37)-N6)-threonylcarbamoyltransferase complex ATPase subunit type 1 TsaE [Arsenophonus sp.]|nr:MAG: tRNA (adenosine(37)-N6)-threonylcarbamoyltransferase complex ATPase subunit type 1 TsaE [Arsenophonus sp.]